MNEKKIKLNKEKKYKFFLKINKKTIIYTGKPIKEDTEKIKIKTIKNETVIINKNNLIQAKQLLEGKQ